MKKKVIWSAVILLVIVGAVYSASHTTLEKQISKNLGTAKGYRIVSVEKMEADKEPVAHDISEKNSAYQAVLKDVKGAALRYVKSETGMEITEPLYTMTIAAGGETMTCTVNSENQIHINQTEVTYVITSPTDLYNLLKKVYDANK
ncbi:MAG: hypothetical protein Q4C18_02530 [Eubacteriales bacterium]|nr:hypothetical protein [Eubacteriales bacterium]